MVSRRGFLALSLAGLSRASVAELFPAVELIEIRAGLAEIYNLQHDRAEARFQRMIENAPGDAAGYVYLATTLWLRELARNQHLTLERFASADFFVERPKGGGPVDRAVETRFRSVCDQAVVRAGKRSDRRSQFLLACAYQNLASFEAAIKRNWWAAFRFGSRTYGLNRELLRQDPTLHDARLAIGVHQYAAGSLGWSVKWLTVLMGYSGSRERGKRELETCAAQGQVAADDARVMLILIYTRERRYDRAHELLEHLHAAYPGNYLVHFALASVAVLRGRRGEALAIYDDILKRNYAGVSREMVDRRRAAATP